MYLLMLQSTEQQRTGDEGCLNYLLVKMRPGCVGAEKWWWAKTQPLPARWSADGPAGQPAATSNVHCRRRRFVAPPFLRCTPAFDTYGIGDCRIINNG